MSKSTTHFHAAIDKLANVTEGGQLLCASGSPNLIDAAAGQIATLRASVAELEKDRDEARAWIDDLQSRMYVNCVYCGHRYGPGETAPVSMAEALKAHIEVCPKHPLSAAIERIKDLTSILGDCRNLLFQATQYVGYSGGPLEQPFVSHALDVASQLLKVKP